MSSPVLVMKLAFVFMHQGGHRTPQRLREVHSFEQLEMLQGYEDLMGEDLNIALGLPGVGNKGDHSDGQQNSACSGIP